MATKICPAGWQVRDMDIVWATEKYTISEAEVARQIELMRDHEFRRPYSDWNRVFRNWMRKCEQIGTFKRERTYRGPEELTQTDRERDQKAFEATMRKYGVEV